MNEIYDQIYDIVAERMQRSEKQMPCTKKAFLYAANAEIGICNVSDMLDMDNLEFMEAAYLGLLGRLPDPGAREVFEQEKQMNKDSFRSELLTRLINSQEAAIKSGEIVGNNTVNISFKMESIYGSVLEKEIAFETPIEKKRMRDHLYAMYKRLPLKVQGIARRMLGRDR